MAERNRVWAAIAVVVAIVAGALALTGCGSGGASYADQVAADANAPQSLVKAADELGFHQTTDPGSGQIERLPAEAAGPARSKLLLDAGDPAPDFELETPQGEKVSLKDLR